MAQKINVDGKEYEFEKLNESSKNHLASLQLVTQKLQELQNLQAIFQRAKMSYLESLKKEVISSKAGILLDDD